MADVKILYFNVVLKTHIALFFIFIIHGIAPFNVTKYRP